MFTIIAVSILIALIFAPLGCLVLWKRYVYFGEGLAHASMLAGVISFMAGMPIFYAGLLSTGIFTFSIFKLKSNSGNNAAIGMVTSIMIAISLVLSYTYPSEINISKYLVGDIISANHQDIATLACILAIVILFFISSYKNLILLILSKDIASARGVRVKLLDLAFLGLLSFAILSTIKIVGALLVTSIILIPAMTAKIVAKSPFTMIMLALIFALMMNLLAIILSFYADIPFAPVIILSGGMMYILVLCANYSKKWFFC